MKSPAILNYIGFETGEGYYIEFMKSRFMVILYLFSFVLKQNIYRQEWFKLSKVSLHGKSPKNTIRLKK